jgi:hypothetical protein
VTRCAACNAHATAAAAATAPAKPAAACGRVRWRVAARRGGWPAGRSHLACKAAQVEVVLDIFLVGFAVELVALERAVPAYPALRLLVRAGHTPLRVRLVILSVWRHSVRHASTRAGAARLAHRSLGVRHARRAAQRQATRQSALAKAPGCRRPPAQQPPQPRAARRTHAPPAGNEARSKQRLRSA